jgi:hypothetical protein
MGWFNIFGSKTNKPITDVEKTVVYYGVWIEDVTNDRHLDGWHRLSKEEIFATPSKGVAMAYAEEVLSKFKNDPNIQIEVRQFRES